MAAGDLEIRITSSNQAGGAFDDLARKAKVAKNELKDLERASKFDADIDAKIKVDDSELQAADRKIAALDAETITVPVDADASEAVAKVEDQLGDVDLSNMAGTMSSQITSLFAGAGPIGAAIGFAAAALGDEFTDGLSSAISRKKDRITDSVRFGLDSSEMVEVGLAAGSAFSDGFGDGLRDLRGTAAILKNELSGIDASLDLTEATKQATVLSDVFGIELPTSINLARRLVTNDLASSTEQAFDLMTATAQQFSINFEEILEVANEFAPVFGKLGISGAEAFGTIGKLVQEGLLPNVDRAAELFEVFNVGLSETDTLRAPIQGLNLDFERMQSLLANGQGGQALKEITGALLEVEDPARRNAVALEIFGAAIESASNPTYALEILNQGAALENVAGAADRATVAIENSNSAAANRRSIMNLLIGDSERFAELEQQAAERAYELANGLQATQDRADEATRSFLEHERAEAAVAEEMENTADAAAGLVAEVEQLEGALQSLSDWADDSGQASLRGVHEAADQIAESFTADIAAAYDLRAGWDVLSESGRAGSETMGQLRGDVEKLTDNFLNGKVGPEAYHNAIRDLEGQFRTAAAAAGLGTAEVDRLTDSLFDLPSDVKPKVTAETQKAQNDIKALNNALDGINGKTSSTYVNNNITTYYRQVGSASKPVSARSSGPRRHGGIVGAAATGGPQDGLTLVGEEGPELVDLPAGANVRTTPDTNTILNRISGGGGGGGGLTVNVLGSVISERELVGIIRDQLLQASISG